MGGRHPTNEGRRAVEVNVGAGQARCGAVAGVRAAAQVGGRDELVVVGGGAVLVAAPRGCPAAAPTPAKRASGGGAGGGAGLQERLRPRRGLGEPVPPLEGALWSLAGRALLRGGLLLRLRLRLVIASGQLQPALPPQVLGSLAVLGHPALPRPRVHPRRRLGRRLGPARRTPLPLAERRLHGPARAQACLEEAPQPREHCSRASRQGRCRREVELGVRLEAERGEGGAACQRGRH